jgi:hypothetical protein
MSPLVQLCIFSLPQALIHMIEGLVIIGQDGIDPNLWRELLQPFTAVKDLYLSPGTAPHVALALQDRVGESAMELFPILKNILLKGLVPEGIEKFVATRQLASRPISVSRCKRDELLIWW